MAPAIAPVQRMSIFPAEFAHAVSASVKKPRAKIRVERGRAVRLLRRQPDVARSTLEYGNKRIGTGVGPRELPVLVDAREGGCGRPRARRGGPIRIRRALRRTDHGVCSQTAVRR
jgi:hypothetical protein